MKTDPAPAVFFDRDGTLNIDTGYIRDPESLRLFDGVPELIARIRARGYRVFVISNQSGLGRGIIRPDEYRNVSRRFLELCGEGSIDEVVYCPHDPSCVCECRKPQGALVDVLAERFAIDMKRSFFIGDKLSDIACGKRFAMRTIFITHGTGVFPSSAEETPDYQVKSIAEIDALLP